MPITLEQYNNVQLYLDGEMTEGQQQEFLSQVYADEELKESLDFERFLRRNTHSIRQAEDIITLSRQEQEHIEDTERSSAVRAIIESAGREWRQDQGFSPAPTATVPTRVISLRRIAWIAAAACLLLVTASLIFFLSRPSGRARTAGAELFAQSFKIEKVPEGNYPLLNKAFKDYNNKDYTAIQSYPLADMPTLKGSGGEHDQVQELGYYYQGISFLATNSPEKALQCFQWVLDHNPSDQMLVKAEWYKSLTLVKMSRLEQAVEFLHLIIINPDAGEYGQRAKTLHDKLVANAN